MSVASISHRSTGIPDVRAFLQQHLHSLYQHTKLAAVVLAFEAQVRTACYCLRAAQEVMSMLRRRWRHAAGSGCVTGSSGLAADTWWGQSAGSYITSASGLIDITSASGLIDITSASGLIDITSASGLIDTVD